MSRFCKYVIIITALAAAGCSPIGTIGGDADFEKMWTVPYRIVYDINDKFQRYEDLSVFASYHGTIQPIPVGSVKISVIEDPDWSNEEVLVPPDDDYYLIEEGRKVIVVKYGNLSARYSIDVRDPYGLGGNHGNGDGSGIIVEWAEP